MPLEKRKGSRFWWIRFEVNGRRVRRSSGTESRREAARKERELRAYYEKHTPKRSRGSVDLAHLAQCDVERAEAGGAGEAQVKAIEYAWAQITDFFGATSALSVVTYAGVERYLQHRTGVDKVSGQTARKERQALKRMCELAHRRGWMPTIPATWPTVRSKTRHKARSGKLHDLETLEKFFEHLKGEAYDEARLALLTGLRAQELRRMTPAWRSEASGGVFVRVPEEGSKTRSERWVGLTGEALEIFDRLAKGKRRDQALLSGSEHRTARRFACKAIKYDQVITLRDLRATYLTVGLQESGDAQATQASAGHSDLRTTQRYQHTTLERNAAVAASVAQALGQNRHSKTATVCENASKWSGRQDLNLRPLAPEAIRLAAKHVLECNPCATAVIRRMTTPSENGGTATVNRHSRAG